MPSRQSDGSGEIGVVHGDADRDRIEVQVRLDKVVVVIDSGDGGQGQAELDPADARALGDLLRTAAGAAEETPR
jgi:hypothetical protein